LKGHGDGPARYVAMPLLSDPRDPRADLPGSSLERRWSSRRFPYGYLVTTSPQSLSLPWPAAPSKGWRTVFG